MARYGNCEMVDVLLKAKVKVNEQAGVSRFALHHSEKGVAPLKFLFYDRYDIDVSLMVHNVTHLSIAGTIR